MFINESCFPKLCEYSMERASIEFYFDFDTYFEQNFASYSSLKEVIQATRKNIQRLSNGEYHELVDMLNLARACHATQQHQFIPRENRFTIDDFIGAVVFPGTAILPLYREKYGGLHPIHLFIALPKKNMESVKKKIGVDGELPQVTFPNTYFPPSSLGFHHTGMTLLEKPEKIHAIEFFSLSWDAVYYSRGYQAAMEHIKRTAKKPYEPQLPHLARIVLEYTLLFEMFAYHALCPSRKSLVNRYTAVEEATRDHVYTRLRRVGVLHSTLAAYPSSNPQTYKNMFEEFAAQQCAKIEKVVDALYFIEETLGANFTWPALFAAGPTKEDLIQAKVLHGPFALLCAFALSLSSGLVTKEQVYQKIHEKGYPYSSSLTQGPVRA